VGARSDEDGGAHEWRIMNDWPPLLSAHPYALPPLILAAAALPLFLVGAVQVEFSLPILVA
jgi:hypothetical protein